MPRVLLVLAVLALPALAGALPLDPRLCPDGGMPEFVPAQGLSCRVDGGWLVLLDGGRTIFTHGPDPVSPAEGVQGGLVQPQFLWHPPPLCVEDPATMPHGQALYTRPHDARDQHDGGARNLRTAIAYANAYLRAEALEFGRVASFVMRCDATGDLSIPAVVLPTSRFADHFGSIANDLRNLGYADPLVKYWIAHDDGVPCNCGGQSELDPYTIGPTYSISYNFQNGCCVNMKTVMHENGHALGAVQPDAPHTTGRAHCNDGPDIMCYDDGGAWGPTSNFVCGPVEHYDCNHDDYFHPSPLPGTYLHDNPHANIAHPANPHVRLARLDEVPTPPQDVQASPGLGGAVVLSWTPPAGDGGSPITSYRIYRQWIGPSIDWIGTASASQTTWTDATPFIAGATYYVSALSYRGEGSLSAPAAQPWS